MITITLQNINVTGNEGLIAFDGDSVGIRIQGHSLFNAKGQDIICAAVSALSQTLVRTVELVGRIPQQWKQERGFLSTIIDTSELNSEKKNFIRVDRLFHDRDSGNC